MALSSLSDDELLASREPGSFAVFYRRHAEDVLAFFARRTRDPELAADLTAETFAAALAGRGRHRPDRGPGAAWLYGIALHKLARAQRRAGAEQRARRRLGMERIELTDGDIERIQTLAADPRAERLMERLAPDQREAVRARVVDELPYDVIARTHDVSEAVVRKRVSRGLSTLRERMGPRP